MSHSQAGISRRRFLGRATKLGAMLSMLPRQALQGRDLLSSSGHANYLVVSCDVEALPRRAPLDHVNRLIWGRFPGVPTAHGIEAMMDIADRRGVEMTFFLDLPEQSLYGESIDGVARAIVSRRHDLQLHAHPDVLPDAWWQSRGFQAPRWGLSSYDTNAVELVFGWLLKEFYALAGTPPLAFRGGAFRYNDLLLGYLHENGLQISSNYNPQSARRPTYPHGFDDGILPPFKWDNGLVEIPVGMLQAPGAPGAEDPRYRAFELNSFSSTGTMLNYMERHWSLGTDYNILCLLMHSWSFLKQDSAGHYVYQGSAFEDLFSSLLDSLPESIEIVSFRRLAALIKENKDLQPKLTKPLMKARQHVETTIRQQPSSATDHP